MVANNNGSDLIVTLIEEPNYDVKKLLLLLMDCLTCLQLLLYNNTELQTGEIGNYCG